jgi:hypothetical protein
VLWVGAEIRDAGIKPAYTDDPLSRWFAVTHIQKLQPFAYHPGGTPAKVPDQTLQPNL